MAIESISLREIKIEDILDKVKQRFPEADLEKILRAYRFAEKAHRGQKRYSGEDYITHSLYTAYTLAEMKLDPPTIAAGILHDTSDDTPVTISQIKKEFGEEIAFLVQGVTKLGNVRYHGIERHVENLRKMFLAMAQDLRVVLIKLADRFHNIKTLESVPKRKQKRIALETIEIYAPIAYRLGMGEMKGQLEDFAFPFAYPKEYRWLKRNAQEKYRERKEYLEKVKPILAGMLQREKVPFSEIHSRAKHYFSLYKKLLGYNRDWYQIYDLVALRVIVPTIKDCYLTLGTIHKKWKPLFGRIKDYISVPKPNGYRSLHTSVFCQDGKVTEIQIRTSRMHEMAENGIAAHWAYNGASKPSNGIIVSKKELAWVNQLRNWQKEFKDPNQFLKSLKIDFFKDRIFVFTTKGVEIDLPQWATALDFAFHIRPDLAIKSKTALVNRTLVPLDYQLQNGEVVEIIPSQRGTILNRSWLNFVRTNLARTKIKEVLKSATPEQNLRMGKFQIQKELSQFKNIKLKDIPTNKKTKLAKTLGFNNLNDLFVEIGKGNLEARDIIETLFSAEELLNYPYALKTTAFDRVGLLKDISQAISKLELNVLALKAERPQNKKASLKISLSIPNVDKLYLLFSELKKVKGMLRVKRI